MKLTVRVHTPRVEREFAGVLLLTAGFVSTAATANIVSVANKYCPDVPRQSPGRLGLHFGTSCAAIVLFLARGPECQSK